MILAIDIGNSNIRLGGFEGDELSFVASLSTDTLATEDEYAIRILGALSFRARRSAYSAPVRSR